MYLYRSDSFIVFVFTKKVLILQLALLRQPFSQEAFSLSFPCHAQQRNQHEVLHNLITNKLTLAIVKSNNSTNQQLSLYICQPRKGGILYVLFFFFLLCKWRLLLEICILSGCTENVSNRMLKKNSSTVLSIPLPFNNRVKKIQGVQRFQTMRSLAPSIKLIY